MTTDEIRQVELEIIETKKGEYSPNINKMKFVLLREIAAQLAEGNEILRQDRDFRRELAAEQRAETQRRDALLSRVGGNMEFMSEFVTKPPQLQPVRLAPPPEIIHLGCLICEPDGTHKIATNDGRLVTLAPEEAQRITALITPQEAEASEPKPN